MGQQGLNVVYSKRSMRRRYEVWFVRLTLADGSGAWWFRYLLMNLGRARGGGCHGNPHGLPVQVWATWFPRNGKPRSFVQGFLRDQLSLSRKGASPFRLEIGGNRMGEGSCTGCLEVEGQRIGWDLRYRSTFGATVTDVGWIGFSRTPHSDAVFSGTISFNERTFAGEPLGYGLQGHNGGVRHRRLWNWTHCFFLDSESGGSSTFEALEYEIPFGLRVRRGLLWHGGTLYVFRKFREILRDGANLQWFFQCSGRPEGSALVGVLDGRGPSIHRLRYLKTDCSSAFEVANNSLARARLYFSRRGRPLEQLSTDGGAVLEMAGV